MPNSRIIIPESARQGLASYQMRVVSVGLEEVCSDPDQCSKPHLETPNPKYPAHPTDQRIKPDAWVIVSPRGLVPTDNPNQWLVNQSDIQAVFTVAE